MRSQGGSVLLLLLPLLVCSGALLQEGRRAMVARAALLLFVLLCTPSPCLSVLAPLLPLLAFCALLMTNFPALVLLPPAFSPLMLPMSTVAALLPKLLSLLLP